MLAGAVVLCLANQLLPVWELMVPITGINVGVMLQVILSWTGNVQVSSY